MLVQTSDDDATPLGTRGVDEGRLHGRPISKEEALRLVLAHASNNTREQFSPSGVPTVMCRAYMLEPSRTTR
jgi:hypothetical protein